jgi:ABC-type transporter Mla subunit MlaD
MNKQLEALAARADEIKEALTFTQELTVALKPEDQKQATASGAAKRVAKTVLKFEQEG